MCVYIYIDMHIYLSIHIYTLNKVPSFKNRLFQHVNACLHEHIWKQNSWKKKKKKGLERTSAELDWIEWTVPGVLLKVIMSEQHIINATVLMSEMHPPFHSSVKDNPFYLYTTLYAHQVKESNHRTFSGMFTWGGMSFLSNQVLYINPKTPKPTA